MTRFPATIFRTLAAAGAMLLLAAAGGVLGYYFPGAFGLRPGTPDAAYGPLVGVTAGLAAGVIALVIAMAVRHRRRPSRPSSSASAVNRLAGAPRPGGLPVPVFHLA